MRLGYTVIMMGHNEKTTRNRNCRHIFLFGEAKFILPFHLEGYSFEITFLYSFLD